MTKSQSAEPRSEGPDRTSQADQRKTTDGIITAIRGGVVDVAFEGGVPRIYDLLYAGDVPLEVA